MMNIEVSGAESEISLSPFLKIKNLLAVIGQNRELFDDHYASMIASLDELEKENISLRERNVDLTALQVFSAHDPLQIPSLPVSNVAPAVALDNHAYEKDRLNFIMLSLRKLGILTERSREGFFLADVDGRIFEWNHSEEQITGLPRDVVLGTFIWDIDMELWGGKNSEKPEEKLTSEQKKATYMDLVQTGLSPVFERIFEFETQRPDGTRRSVQISFFPIQTEKGFGDTQPIPPGSGYQLVYAYDLHYDRQAAITLTMPVPVQQVVVMLPNDGISLTSPQLQFAGNRDVQGASLQLFVGANLAAGSPLQVNLTGTPKASPAGMTTNLNLLVGLAVFLLALAVSLFWFYQRQLRSAALVRRMSKTRWAGQRVDTLPVEETQDTLLDAVVALDDLYREGKLAKDPYQARRNELVRSLKEIRK